MKWKEFRLGDSEIFLLNSTLNGINKNKLNQLGTAKYPYITRTDFNNGLDILVGKQEKPINPGNVISIGLDTQTVFYQEAPFYTGQNIQILSINKLNQNSAMFIIPLIKRQLATLNWGGNGATLGRLQKKSILLPVQENDEIDFDFMEQYILVKKKQVKAAANIFKENDDITDHRSLHEIEFKNFYLEDVIKINSGQRLTKEDMKKGNIAFIGATEFKNGITGFVSNINKSTDCNVLGVNYNGSVVESFYHPYHATFSDDVKRFSWNNEMVNNKYTLLFLKSMLNMQRIKYTYGYKFNAARMKKQVIKLPVDSDGKPDWGFMEQYMKRKENQVLYQLKNF